MKFEFVNFYIVIPIAIIIFSSLEGMLGESIKRFMSNLLNPKFIIISILIYILSMNFGIETVYALDEETVKKLTEDEAARKLADINNNININNPNINIPNSVFKGLTNIGIAGAIGGGMSAMAKIAKTSALSPGAKVGLVAGGGLLGGALIIATNAVNSLLDKSTNFTNSEPVKKNINEPKSSGNGPVAFSIEPQADLDTLMALLYANYYIHICVLIFIWSLLILFISNKVVNHQWNLEWVRIRFGLFIHKALIKSLTYTNKSNNIFMLLGLILLIISSMYGLYIASFLINHIDVIIDIIKESKK